MKKKRAKKYKPKSIHALPIVWRGTADAADAGLHAWAALERLSTPEADYDDGAAVAMRIEQSYYLAKNHLSGVETEEPIAYMESAIIALGQMIERHKTTSRMGCTGQELQALRYGLEMADLMQGAATGRELRGSLLDASKAHWGAASAKTAHIRP